MELEIRSPSCKCKRVCLWKVTASRLGIDLTEGLVLHCWCQCVNLMLFSKYSVGRLPGTWLDTTDWAWWSWCGSYEGYMLLRYIQSRCPIAQHGLGSTWRLQTFLSLSTDAAVIRYTLSHTQSCSKTCIDITMVSQLEGKLSTYPISTNLKTILEAGVECLLFEDERRLGIRWS